MSSDEWFEIEVAYNFRPDSWSKTYRFDQGARSDFPTLEAAQAHVRSMRSKSSDLLYVNALYRYVRYTREVINATD